MKQVVTKNNLGADFILDVPNSKIYSNQILTGTVAPSANPSVTGKRWLWINTAVGIITHYWNGSAWINLVDADKGDITVSSNGTTMTIDANVVTYAKFQQITTDTLVGRDTAGTGNAESISVGGGIEFTGTGGIRTSAFTGDVTKAAAGTVLTLATVNSTVGTYGNAGNVAQVTVNAKGLTTVVANVPIQITASQVTDFTEAAQDFVGAMLADSNSIDVTYNDAVNTEAIDVKVRNTSTANTTITASGVGVDVINNTSTQKHIVAKAGTDVGTRQKINFIEGTNVTMTVADNAGSDRVDVTINANATIQDNIRLSSVTDSIGSTDNTVVYTNAVTSSLPSPVNKRKVTIKNGNAATYISVVGHIDGTASSTISVPPKNSMTFHSDGNTWYVI